MGKYLNMVRQTKGASLNNGTAAITPGCLITWQGADLTVRQGVVDFVHTEPNGTVWAFYVLPDGTWGAVNMSSLTKSEPK